jgi:hypothetical protein
MGDYERCADLCDDRGFARQAALLREVGAGHGRAYVVEETRRVDDESEWDDAEEPAPEPETTRTVFLDRKAAERFAREMSARALRGLVARFDLRTGDSFQYLTSLSRAEFCSLVGEILGRPYQLPAQGEPLIPGPATDAKLLRIVPLLNLEFCTVVAVDIAP